MLIWFVVDHVLICFFDIIWTPFVLSHFYVSIWFKWYLVQIVSPLVLESLVHAYLLYVNFMACLLSLIQYIGETPPYPKLAKMCMKFNFISICTCFCGVCPLYCSLSNYFGPN
jgi:hypothetical protein